MAFLSMNASLATVPKNLHNVSDRVFIGGLPSEFRGTQRSAHEHARVTMGHAAFDGSPRAQVDLLHAAAGNNLLDVPGSDASSRHDDDAPGSLLLQRRDQLQPLQ